MRKTTRKGSGTRRLSLCLGMSAWLLWGCNATVEQPQSAQQGSPKTPAVSPAVSVNAVMVALVDHAGHVLWDVADQQKTPKTDKDWGELEHHAIQMAASGTLIALGGAGPADPGWAQLPGWQKYSKELTDGGLAALSAARRKDQEALLKAGDQLVATCEGCHKEFKPELPTEGLVHPHYR